MVETKLGARSSTSFHMFHGEFHMSYQAIDRALRGTRRKQAGLNMIELVLVLAVVAVVIIGGLAFYSNATRSAQLNGIASSATFMQGKIKGYFQVSRDGYNGLNELVARQGNMVPQNYTQPPCAAAGPDCLRSELGNEVSVLPSVVDGTANRGFSVTYHRVPAEMCSDMVAQLANSWTAVRVTPGSAAAPSVANRTIDDTDNVAAAAAATALLQNKLNADPAQQLASAAVIAGTCNTNTTSDVVFISAN